MLIFNPRQTVLVTCRGTCEYLGKTEEQADILPLHWHSPASAHPPMYAIFVNKTLLAVQMIRNSGVFVVNFMPFALVETVKKAMTISAHEDDKSSALGLHELSCEKILDCFRLKEAIGWLECEVVEEKEAGDCVLFLGKVLFSEIKRDEKRPFHVDGNEFTTTR